MTDCEAGYLLANVVMGKESGPSAIGKADGVSGRRLMLRPFSKRVIELETR